MRSRSSRRRPRGKRAKEKARSARGQPRRESPSSTRSGEVAEERSGWRESAEGIVGGTKFSGPTAGDPVAGDCASGRSQEKRGLQERPARRHRGRWRWKNVPWVTDTSDGRDSRALGGRTHRARQDIELTPQLWTRSQRARPTWHGGRGQHSSCSAPSSGASQGAFAAEGGDDIGAAHA